jgi:hypothetical protein
LIVCLQAERRVQEQRTRKGTQPFFIGVRTRDAEEEEQEDPRAARARAQAERRAEQDRAKQEAASARAQEQVCCAAHTGPWKADSPGSDLLPFQAMAAPL